MICDASQNFRLSEQVLGTTALQTSAAPASFDFNFRLVKGIKKRKNKYAGCISKD